MPREHGEAETKAFPKGDSFVDSVTRWLHFTAQAIGAPPARNPTTNRGEVVREEHAIGKDDDRLCRPCT